MNIYSAIAQGAKILKEKFIAYPILDSEILMSKVIKQDRKCVLLKSDHVLSKCELNYFQKLIKIRSNGKPIAHITNKKNFWISEFFVTENTLIPRPDTELIIDNVLKLTKFLY